MAASRDMPSKNPVINAWRRFARFLASQMPKGLFARALIIIIYRIATIDCRLRLYGAALADGHAKALSLCRS
jgi:hypothetical protein